MTCMVLRGTMEFISAQSKRLFDRCTRGLVAGLTVVCAFTALADADTLGKVPTYWYTFDGAVTSHGASALKCAFNDSTYAFLPCRGDKKGWRVNPEKSYHAENVFAPNNGSFTLFVSMDPGTSSQTYRYIFSLGNNTSTTNLALVKLFGNRIGVARWDRTHCGSELRAYGLLAADGVANRVHPYALVYDGNEHMLTLYSGGVACAEAPFEGFGGSDGDATQFQFGSVHGGRVLPYSKVPTGDSVAAGLPVIEDFRFYNEALSAAEVAAISDELPSTWTAEEAEAVGPISNHGELPRYWYTFDGAVRSRGCSDFLDSYNADYPAHKIPTPVSYADCRTDGKAGKVSETPHGDWVVQNGGSFTLFLSCTLGTTDQNIILALGQNTSTKNLALVRQSSTQVKIVNWNSTSSIKALVTATVDDPVNYVHPYVVRYSKDTGKIELFVNGYKAGEASYAGLDTTSPTAFQFGSMRGGNLHSLKAYKDVKLEALKYYERAISDAEIVAMSDEYVCGSGKRPTSDIGRNPDYWYMFDETAPRTLSAVGLPMVSSSYPAAKLIQTGTAAFARKASFAATGFQADYGTGKTSAYGSELDMSGPFSIFFSARLRNHADHGVFFSLGGNGDNATNLAVTADKSGNVALERWTQSPRKIITLVRTSGLDSAADFHPYAVVWDGTKLHLYVDGAEAGSSTDFGDISQKKFQFAGVHGGTDHNIGLWEGGFALEDFRIYKNALSAAEVGKLSARYAKWPNGALVWNGGSSGSWDYSSVCWRFWDTANWCSVNQAFTSGASALFECQVDALDVASGIVADNVKFAADSRWSSVNSVTCTTLEMAEDVTVLPVGVSKTTVPGLRLFNGFSSALYPKSYHDDYGNAYYSNGLNTSLFFGKRGGLAIIIR